MFKPRFSIIALVAILFGAMIFSAHRAHAAELTMSAADGTKTVMTTAQLEELPVSEISTSTPWTDGVHTFKGVSFADLLDEAGIKAKEVRVSALNDYNIVIPTEELRDSGAILAYLFDGAEMSIRDKGPYWVIFPFDSDVRFQTDRYWSYAVWQVKSINVGK
jgi:hypothetical protein